MPVVKDGANADNSSNDDALPGVRSPAVEAVRNEPPVQKRAKTEQLAGAAGLPAGMMLDDFMTEQLERSLKIHQIQHLDKSDELTALQALEVGKRLARRSAVML